MQWLASSATCNKKAITSAKNVDHEQLESGTV
jgi:hypothetical protein